MGNKKTAASPDTDADSSLPSRIAQSASDLTKSFVSNSAAGASATIATLADSASTGKSHAESSTSGSSKAIEDLPFRGLHHPSKGPVLSPGFREHTSTGSFGQGSDILSDEVQHFSTAPVDFSQWDVNSRARTQDPWFEHFREGHASIGGASQLGPQEWQIRQTASGFDAKSFAEHNDGSEVIALLTNHDLTEDWEQENFERGGIPEPSASDLFSSAYTPEEQDMANRLRDGLDLASTHDTGNQMNVLPNFEDLPLASVAEDVTLEQREAWLQQWYSVLTNYTDEVWGDSLPHVEEARREIEQLQEEKDDISSKQALRRLRMILGHVQLPPVQKLSAKSRGKRPVRFAEPPINGAKG